MTGRNALPLLDQLTSRRTVHWLQEAKKKRRHVNFMSIKERPCQMTVNN